MIKKLTKEQEAKFEEYVEKYIKIGLNTDKIDKKKGNRIIELIYKEILSKDPVPIIYFDEPIKAWIAACMFSTGNSELLNASNNEREIKLNKFAKDNKHLISDFAYPYLDGSFSSSYFSFYDYMFEILGIDNPVYKKYEIYKSTLQLGLVYPLDTVCIVSEKPSSIKMKDGVLHCEDGPALTYGEDFNIYCLNGVRVSEELVMTPAIELDPKIMLKETNAEIRREIVRKIGINRICHHLNAKVIDKFEDYELLILDIGDNQRRPYLKMINPSTNIFHIEGVPPDCNTVKKALAWRNGSDDYEEPVVLT